MASSNASRKKGGTANKDGTSHHTFRGAEEQHTKKRACENANVERDKEKAEWEKEKANLQRSLEEEKHKTMITENKMKELQEKNERETRQLQVENKYLKLILDDLHKSIIVGEATLQKELKPPEDIQNDKLLMELTTNTRTIHLKFYELETELDYIHKTISQLTSSIVGDDRSNEPTQEKTNKFTATGRQPKRNPAKTFEQREQSSKIDTDIELVTSVWWNLKEKEREFNESKTEWENYCEKLNEKHKKETKQLRKAIKRLTVEKDKLLTSLTTIASDRLTHVNIADLSDADSPTKLQEGYLELYDDEWFDAFKELTMHGNTTEYDAIIILLKILMSSFQNCREITWGRYERLKNVASYIEQEISLQSPKKGAKDNVGSGDTNASGVSKDKSENKKGKKHAKESVPSGDPNVREASKDKSENKKGKHLMCTIDLNFELTNVIKGIWRKTTLELKGIAAEPLYSLIETCLDMPFTVLPFTSKYLKRCIDLCWKMGFQEKPLHLDGVAEMDAYAGKKFDKDKFRAYTHSGSHIAFIVWPTLYLYEGGPIVVKGIAQCCSPVEGTNEKPS